MLADALWWFRSDAHRVIAQGAGDRTSARYAGGTPNIQTWPCYVGLVALGENERRG